MSILISEKIIEEKMIEFIKECDADEFCRIAENMFGGKFTWAEVSNETFGDGGLEEFYEIETDENYCGAFGEIED